MKKSPIFISALILMSGMTAMAAGSYVSDNNSVSINEPNSNTVLIAKNTGSAMQSQDIVYVGQNDAGFTNGTSFMLKNDTTLTDGFYTIVLGSADGKAAKSTNFFIGNVSTYFAGEGTTELKELANYSVTDESGDVTKAYVSDDALTLSEIKTIVVTYDDKTVYSSVDAQTEITGGGSAKIGVKLSGIPAGNADSVKVSISNKAATGLKLN